MRDMIQSEAWEKALANWDAQFVKGTSTTTYIDAEARTGSRYAVVVTDLPEPAARREGGQLLVSVLQPWQSCYPISVFPGEDLHPTYVMEHWLPPRKAPYHPGDVAALVATINAGIQMHLQQDLTVGVLPEQRKEDR